MTSLTTRTTSSNRSRSTGSELVWQRVFIVVTRQMSDISPSLAQQTNRLTRIGLSQAYDLVTVTCDLLNSKNVRRLTAWELNKTLSSGGSRPGPGGPRPPTSCCSGSRNAPDAVRYCATSSYIPDISSPSLPSVASRQFCSLQATEASLRMTTTYRDLRLFRIYVRCPCNLLTLCHHNQFVYDDDDDDEFDFVTLRTLSFASCPTNPIHPSINWFNFLVKLLQ